MATRFDGAYAAIHHDDGSVEVFASLPPGMMVAEDRIERVILDRFIPAPGRLSRRRYEEWKTAAGARVVMP